MVKARPAPLQHTERLLSLVPFISANQGISLKDLAATFNVSESQMSADLTTLWMCGLPGYTALELMDLSFESGFVSIRNAQTLENPRTLNFDEIVALLMGLDLLKESLDADSNLHEKIEVLTSRLSQKSGIVSRLRATSDVSSSLRAQIESALRSQSSLDISYHSLYNDSVSERLVSPLELRIENGTEYLLAFCHNAGAFRIFRLDRILKCVVKEKAHIPKQESNSNNGQSLEFTIRVNSRLRLMKERFAIPHISTSDEYQSLSYSQQWIIRSVFGSSGSVQLIEPANLRAQIAQKAQLILDRYLAN